MRQAAWCDSRANNTCTWPATTASYGESLKKKNFIFTFLRVINDDLPYSCPLNVQSSSFFLAVSTLIDHRKDKQSLSVAEF